MSITTGQCLGRFAFLIHPTSTEDLLDSGPSSFAGLTPGQRHNWEQWITSWSQRRHEPGVVYHLPALHSRAGGYVEGWLICIPLTPSQLMRLKPQEKARVLDECARLAAGLGVDMLGLGAYTSIISRAGVDFAGCGVNLTTGNSLTAMVAAESLRIVARRLRRDLAGAEVGVIGAAGSVGRLACKRLAGEARQLTLFGNPASPGSAQKLEALAGEIYADCIDSLHRGVTTGIGGALPPLGLAVERAWSASLEQRSGGNFQRLHAAVAEQARCTGMRAPISVTTDLRGRLPAMQFLISATSQGKAFIEPGWLAADAVVCDAARPADVVADIRQVRPDVFVYEGGLMRLPEPVSFGRRNLVGCAPGVNLACLSETMVLAMSGIRRDASLGPEPCHLEAQRIFALARHHGFEVFVPEAPDAGALPAAPADRGITPVAAARAECDGAALAVPA